MPVGITYFFSAIVVIFLALTVHFSIRYRREKEPIGRGINTAKMNISMGIMLVAMTIIQYIEGGFAHLLLGTVFVFIGLFNLFAGIRNYSGFQAQKNRNLG